MNLFVVADRYTANCSKSAIKNGHRSGGRSLGHSQTLSAGSAKAVFVAVEKQATKSACLLPDIYHIFKRGAPISRGSSSSPARQSTFSM